MNSKPPRSDMLPFAMLLFLAFPFVTCSAQIATNLTTDYSALLSFKSHITNDPFNVLANWSTTTKSTRYSAILLKRAIDVKFNGLFDSLPVDMCDHHSKLEVISIAFNYFHGEIPSSLYKCQQLRQLSASYNEFNGSIAREIGNLTMLRKLFLGANKFEGSIPLEIGNLINLEMLSFLNGFYLTGPIPSAIFNISSLRMIDFTNNSLSGSLPVGDIHYNLPLLNGLYLNHNRLSGRIPSSLGKLGGLQFLALADNNLAGSIPKEIVNLTMLTQLYLGGNHFTEYGTQGIVSIKGDVYSYGIMLIETFTRKRPTDELFSGERSLRDWVKAATHGSVNQVLDTNLINLEDEHISAKEQCVSSLFDLAMDCTRKSPTRRVNMEEVVVRLNKIKITFLANNEPTPQGRQ